MVSEGEISGTYLIKTKINEFEDSAKEQFKLVQDLLETEM